MNSRTLIKTVCDPTLPSLPKLTRAAGDHLISKEEIVAFCQKNPEALSVLGVESVEALMGKFDGDGSGELDEEELKQLRAYINEKRAENQERIRKLQESVGKSALRPVSAGPRVGCRLPVYFSLAPHAPAPLMACHRCTLAPGSLMNPRVMCCS